MKAMLISGVANNCRLWGSQKLKKTVFINFSQKKTLTLLTTIAVCGSHFYQYGNILRGTVHKAHKAQRRQNRPIRSCCGRGAAIQRVTSPGLGVVVDNGYGKGGNFLPQGTCVFVYYLASAFCPVWPKTNADGQMVGAAPVTQLQARDNSLNKIVQEKHIYTCVLLMWCHKTVKGSVMGFRHRTLKMQFWRPFGLSKDCFVLN